MIKGLLKEVYPRTVDVLYSASLFIYLFFSVVWDSFFLFILPSFTMKIVSVLVLVLLLVVEIIQLKNTAAMQTGENRFWWYFLAVLTAIAFGLSSYLTDNGAVLIVFAFVITARHVSYDQIALVALLAICSACLLVVLSTIAGVIEDYVWIQRRGERVRHGLGFRYATYLSHYIFFAFLLYFYLRRGKAKLLPALAVLAAATLVFFLTNSRNAYFLTLAMLLISALWNKISAAWNSTLSRPGKMESFIKTVLCAMPFVASALSVGMMVFYNPDNPVFRAMNSLLGSRVSISHAIYKSYGVTLFGQYMELQGNGIPATGAIREAEQVISYIDNSYCKLLVNNGALVLLILITAYTLLMKKAVGNRNLVIVLLIVFVLAHSVIDSWLLVLRYNTTLLLIGTYLLGSDAAADESSGPLDKLERQGEKTA